MLSRFVPVIVLHDPALFSSIRSFASSKTRLGVSSSPNTGFCWPYANP